MLKLAFFFEFRSLLRNRAGATALLAYLAIGALALVLGERHVEEWRTAVETATVEQDRSIADAQEFLTNGESGPSEKPWVNLSQPMWQDRYAGTRVAREPGALAGVAAGSVDPAPVVFHIHRRADPLAVGGYRIENPELSTGSVDLVFVLSILTPLLLGVLGFDIGGRERERRIDRLIVVQAGSVGNWLLARMVAVTSLVIFASSILCLSVALFNEVSPREIGCLIGFSSLYTAIWGGLLLAVNGNAPSVRAGAFAFGSVWALLCVLMPTLIAEVGISSVQTDFAVTETLKTRELAYDAYEGDIEDLTATLYTHYPELSSLPAASDAELEPHIARHAYDGILFQALAQRHADRLDQEQATMQLAQNAAWISPPVALTLALERLSGTGPDAASAYRSHLMDAVQNRIGWILVNAWSKADLGQSDFQSLTERGSPPFRWQPSGLTGPFLSLGVWMMLSWTCAILVLRRIGRRLNAGYE